MDQELWGKALNFHGPLLLQTLLSEEKIQDSELQTESDKVNMCKFIKDKLHLLFKLSPNKTNLTTYNPAAVVPIELFQNVSPEDRRDLFFKTIERGSILILQVMNDSLIDNYKLVALCKEDEHMKLDDLSIDMYLPKLKAEMDLAGGKLEAKDLIRAAVCSCNIDLRQLYVTLDSNILDDDAENVKLGKITEKEIPSYVGNVDLGSSYVEYLHNINYFSNPNWAEDLNKTLNLNRKHLFSFFDGWDGKKYPPEEYGVQLKEKQDLALSNAQYQKGLKCYSEGNFDGAALHYNNALTIYPKNADVLVARAKLYSNKNNLRKAFVDMEEALKINPKHEEAQKHMANLLAFVARINMDNNDFEKAEESLDASLTLDSNNQDAIAALNELKQRREAGEGTSDENLNKTLDISDKQRPRIGSNDSSSSRKSDEQRNFLSRISSFTTTYSLKKKKHNKRKEKHHHYPNEHPSSNMHHPPEVQHSVKHQGHHPVQHKLPPIKPMSNLIVLTPDSH